MALEERSRRLATRTDGWDATITLEIANQGSGPLRLSSIASSDPAFVPSASSMDIGPRSSSFLSVTVQPRAVGVFSGSLTLRSDDPHMPEVILPLSASATEPPVASVQPGSLQSALMESAVETRTLMLTNAGTTTLHFVTNTSAPIRVRCLP